MLAYFELRFFRFGKQIANSFVVDLKHTNFNLKWAIPILVSFDLLKNAIADDRNESLVGTITNHGVAFAWPGLAVSK